MNNSLDINRKQQWDNGSGIHLFSEHLFAPLEYNKSAIEELLEQPIHYS